MMHAVQVRMARAALGISVRELAERSGVADSTILRFETGKGAILTTNMARIQNSLEEAGVVFIPADAAESGPVRSDSQDAQKRRDLPRRFKEMTAKARCTLGARLDLSS